MIDSGGVLNCVVETWAPDGGCHTAASNHQVNSYVDLLYSRRLTIPAVRVTPKNAFHHSFAEGLWCAPALLSHSNPSSCSVDLTLAAPAP